MFRTTADCVYTSQPVGVSLFCTANKQVDSASHVFADLEQRQQLRRLVLSGIVCVRVAVEPSDVASREMSPTGSLTFDSAAVENCVRLAWFVFLCCHSVAVETSAVFLVWPC